MYWSLANSGSELSQSEYISEAIGIEQLCATLNDSSAFTISSSPVQELLSESSKIDITNIPNEYLAYNLSDLEEDIKDFAFSEVVEEGEIMDFLIKDPENTLKIIEKDSSLTESFEYWLEGLETPTGWLSFSDDYPAELHARRLDYLIEELKKSKSSLAEKTWKALNKVEIVNIE